jgi:hypothetical protein
MSFYLGDEVRGDNVAVNAIMPGHSTHGWFNERARMRMAQGRPPGQRPMSPWHAVPIVQFLATQDGTGITGKLFDVVTWNQEHGLGGPEAWKDHSFPSDIEEAFAQAERATVGSGAGGRP